MMSISSVLEGDADGARVLGRAAVIAPDTEGEDVALLGRAGVDDLSRGSPLSRRESTPLPNMAVKFCPMSLG